jgi:predicted RNA binding protein YcfA (HicA-like mRNA interferase family)
MTYAELKKLLKKSGCFFHHQGRCHEIWENPKTGKQFPVGRHNSEDVREGTLQSIKKDAGIK